MKPFHIILALLVMSTRAFAQDTEYQLETVTYDLDGGNMNATSYNPMYFNPEQLHANNVSMEPVTYNDGDEGVFTLGWNMEGVYDSSRYLSLLVDINPGSVLHLDSVTFIGTGLTWYGPTVSGVRIFVDEDTLQGGYAVGWQVCDSILNCVVPMWYMMPYPYDTLVNWWQINARHYIELRFFAWSGIPDTLGNPMDETGWIVDHIQLHGKIFPDLSTSVPEPRPPLDLLTVGDKPVEIYDAQGRKVAERLSYLQDAVPGIYTVRHGGQVRKVMTKQ